MKAYLQEISRKFTTPLEKRADVKLFEISGVFNKVTEKSYYRNA